MLPRQRVPMREHWDWGSRILYIATSDMHDTCCVVRLRKSVVEGTTHNYDAMFINLVTIYSEYCTKFNIPYPRSTAVHASS